MSMKKSSIIKKFTALILVVLMLFSVVPVSNVMRAEALEKKVTTSGTDATPDEAPTEPTTENTGSETDGDDIIDVTDTYRVKADGKYGSTETTEDVSYKVFRFINSVTFEFDNKVNTEGLKVYIGTVEAFEQGGPTKVWDKVEYESYIGADKKYKYYYETLDSNNVKVNMIKYMGMGLHKILIKDKDDKEIANYYFYYDNVDPSIADITYDIEKQNKTKDVYFKAVDISGLGISDVIVIGLGNNTPYTCEKVTDGEKLGFYKFVAANGSQEYKITVIDKSGRQVSVNTELITLDTKPPLIDESSIKGYIGNEEFDFAKYTNKNVTVKFKVTDEGDDLTAENISVTGVVDKEKVNYVVEAVEGEKDYYSFEASNTQTQKYEIKAKDNSGNEAKIVTKTISIDNKAPDKFNIYFEKIEGDNVLNFLSFGVFGNDSIKATVEVVNDEDASAVKDIYLFEDENDTTGLEGTQDNNKKTFIITNKKSYDFYVKASDEAGNISNSFSIKGDNVTVYAENIDENYKELYQVILSEAAPNLVNKEILVESKISKEIDGETYYKDTCTISATLEDTLSGLKDNGIEVSLKRTDDSAVVDASKKYEITSTEDEDVKGKIVSKTIKYTTSAELSGEYIFTIKATNNCGNTASIEKKIKIDNSSPTVQNITYQDDSNVKYVNHPVITFEVKDEPKCCSGVSEVSVKGTNGTQIIPTQDQNTKNKYSFTADTTQIYIIIVTDQLGNKKTFSTENVLVDNDPPVISDINYNKEWTNEDVKVTFKVNDEISGVNTIKVTSPDDDPVNVITTDGDPYFMASEYGMYKISATDMAKNESEQVTETILIDKTKPELTGIKVEKANNSLEKMLNILTFGIYSNTDIKVTVQAKDRYAVEGGVNQSASSGFDESSLKILKNNDTDESITPDNTEVNGNETEGCEIESSFVLECDKDTGVYDIKVLVEDKVGNSVTGYIGMKDGSPALYMDNSKKVEIVATSEAPSISYNNNQGIGVSFSNDSPLDNVNGKEEPKVYSGIGTFTAKVTDEKSGLKDIYMYFGKADEITFDENGNVNTKEKNIIDTDDDYKDISKNNEGKVVSIDIGFETQELENGIYTFAIVSVNNSGNSATEYVTVAVDNTEPTVYKFTLKTTEGANKFFDKKTLFTNQNVNLAVSASDSHPTAGFDKVEVFDGEELIASSKEPYNTADITFETDLTKKDENIDLSATAVDKFKHEKTVKITETDNVFVDSEDKPLQYVHIDTKTPVITNFKFAETADNTNQEHSSPEVRDYGYYFKDKTTVTVTASDFDGSGIRAIRFMRSNINGESKSFYEPVNSNSGETASATFDIPANFKGHIYANAVDNLNQDGADYCPQDLVVEDKFMHDNSSYISFSRAKTGHKDINGLDLYAGDVPVTITVGDTHSGISKVEYFVNAPYDQSNNIKETVEINKNDGSLTEIKGWNVISHDKNLVTEMSKTITVSNNSNTIEVIAKITDNAGHVREEKITPFSIDKTNPVIKVVYDNNTFKEYLGQKYFDANRTATITVTERNFNKNGFEAIIKQPYEISGWSSNIDTSNPDNSTHTVQIMFSADEDYTVDMSFKDLVGRSANAIAQEKFTIDKTKPIINVSFDNNSSVNNNYFKAQRTATITINEHNFAPDTEHLAINITALGEDNISAVTPPSVSNWSTNGDVHTATIAFANDGKYAFTVDYKDLAYNVAEQAKVNEFYVDKTLPDIKFEEVKNNVAYSGEIAPQVVLTDNNYDGYTTFTLQRIDMKAKAQVVDFDKTSLMMGSSGEIVTYKDFAHIEDNDGIYKLTVKMMDKAGNEKSSEIVFSVNRFGSTFMAGNDQTSQLVATGYTNAESNIVIKEINVNKVSAQTISLSLNNSEIKQLKVNKDFTVANSGGSDSWHEYSYNINKDNFIEEGFYTLTLSTTDSVKHTISNRTALTDSRKYPVSFTVDKTDPSVRITGVEANVPYEEASKTVKVICEDANVNPEALVIKLNGDVLEADKDYKLTNDNAGEVIATFDVEAIGNDFKQSIEASIVDLAGNDNKNDVSDFILSASLLTRFFANTPLVIITFSCLAIAIATTLVIIVKKRKKNEQN